MLRPLGWAVRREGGFEVGRARTSWDHDHGLKLCQSLLLLTWMVWWPTEANALCTELNTNTPGPGAGEAKGGSRGRWKRRQVWLLICANEMSQHINDKM